MSTRKFLAITLALFFVIGSLPIYAREVQKESNDAFQMPVSEHLDVLNNEKTDVSKIAYNEYVEVEALREENVKHFQRLDGTYEAIVYGNAIHRKDSNGKWIDIDNRLLLELEDGKTRYATLDNRYSFSSKIAKDESIVVIQGQNYKIDISLALQNNFSDCVSTIPQIENHLGRETFEKTIQSSSISATDKFECLKNINNSSSIVYRISNSEQIQYVLSSNDIMTNIVISESKENNKYVFDLYLDKMTAELTDTGEVLFRDTNENIVFVLDKPYLTDANGSVYNGVEYSLENLAENEYELTVLATPRIIGEFIQINMGGSSATTWDTYVSSAYPDSNYGSSKDLWIGSTRTTFIRATKPTLPANATITEAKLNAYYYYWITTGSLSVTAHKVEQYWGELTHTWTNANSYVNLGLDSNILDTKELVASANITETTPQRVQFDILEAVKDWYAGGNNYGIALKYVPGSTNASVILKSSEAALVGSNNYCPYMSIIYTQLRTTFNGEYFIRNAQKGTYMQVDNKVAPSYATEGAIMEMWVFDGGEYQQWEITNLQNGYHKIISIKSGKALSVNPDYLNSGDKAIIQTTYQAGKNQQWKITFSGDNRYVIRPRSAEAYSTDWCLCVGSGTKLNGIDVEQRTYNGKNTSYLDEWYINAFSDYGNRTYWDLNSEEYSSVNCMGYALQRREHTALNWLSDDAQNSMNNYSCSVADTLALVKGDFEAWLDDNGYHWAEIDIGTQIDETQYRLVLRIGKQLIDFEQPSFYFSDYHFWYQTNTGHWANKHGSAAPELLGINEVPESSNSSGWELPFYTSTGIEIYSNFYDSEILYYVIMP